jgi:hypothetical protein
MMDLRLRARLIKDLVPIVLTAGDAVDSLQTGKLDINTKRRWKENK